MSQTQEVSLHDLQQKGKLPAKDAGIGTVKRYLELNKQALMDVLPKSANADRMMRLCLGAIRTTPGLMECTIESLMSATMTAAQFNLEPNTPLQQCFLIPYNVSYKEGNTFKKRKDVQFQLGYKGVLELIRRSGQVKKVQCQAFYSNDIFEFEFGTDEHLTHKIMPQYLNDRGTLQGFYAYAILTDGDEFIFDIMSKGDVDKIMEKTEAWKNAEKSWGQSPPKRNSPWHLHYVEQGRKTMIKRLGKKLPQSVESANAIALDHAAEVGKPQDLQAAIEGEFVVTEVDTPEGSDVIDTETKTPPQTTPESVPEGVDPKTGEDKRGQKKGGTGPKKDQDDAPAAVKPDDGGPPQPPDSAYEDAPAPNKQDDDLPELN